MRAFLCRSLMVLALVVPAAAQEKPVAAAAEPKPAAAPALTLEQKQAVQILAQRIELAQLRAQAAQTEFEKARAEVAQLVQSLQKDGYDLDLQTMTYTKKLAPVKTPEKKDDPK